MDKDMNIKIEQNTYYKGVLPPLPQRAISGLPADIEYTSDKLAIFHKVHLREFTNLYVILEDEAWKKISAFLKQSDLRVLERQLQIKKRVLEEIQRSPTYATHISNL
jgi:hypothetical protein